MIKKACHHTQRNIRQAGAIPPPFSLFLPFWRRVYCFDEHIHKQQQASSLPLIRFWVVEKKKLKTVGFIFVSKCSQHILTTMTLLSTKTRRYKGRLFLLFFFCSFVRLFTLFLNKAPPSRRPSVQHLFICYLAFVTIPFTLPGNPPKNTKAISLSPSFTHPQKCTSLPQAAYCCSWSP